MQRIGLAKMPQLEEMLCADLGVMPLVVNAVKYIDIFDWVREKITTFNVVKSLYIWVVCE